MTEKKDVFDMNGEEIYAEYMKNNEKINEIFKEISLAVGGIVKAIEADDSKESLVTKANRLMVMIAVRSRQKTFDIINANYRLGMVETFNLEKELERLQQ